VFKTLSTETGAGKHVLCAVFQDLLSVHPLFAAFDRRIVLATLLDGLSPFLRARGGAGCGGGLPRTAAADH
jgi:hypothetical protein